MKNGFSSIVQMSTLGKPGERIPTELWPKSVNINVHLTKICLVMKFSVLFQIVKFLKEQHKNSTELYSLNERKNIYPSILFQARQSSK